MKNSGDPGGCYPPRPTASTDNTLLDLHNSSSDTQPHSLTVNYLSDVNYPTDNSSHTDDASLV